MKTNRDDARHMAHALRLAARAAGRTRPNPLVGCVIVKEGRIIGRGWHRAAGQPHAEVEALAQAGAAARGADCHVTLEPCSHHGRTPPCAEALIKAGVGRVVAAMEDPNPQVSGRGLALLRAAGIETAVGVCEAQARKFNAPFLSWIMRRRPLVTIKAAASLDGRIATRTGQSQWITAPPARSRVQRMRDTHDVVMVGIGTALADDPSLNCRLTGGRDPIRLVVDSNLRLPENAKLLSISQQAPAWIAVSEWAGAERVARFEAMPRVQVIQCQATPEGQVDLADLMMRLGRMEVLSVLSEAGGRLTQALLDARLADRLALFLAPKLIGGSQAPGVFNGLGIAALGDAARLEAMEIRRIGPDLLIEGDLAYPDAD